MRYQITPDHLKLVFGLYPGGVQKLTEDAGFAGRFFLYAVAKCNRRATRRVAEGIAEAFEKSGVDREWVLKQAYGVDPFDSFSIMANWQKAADWKQANEPAEEVEAEAEA